MRGAHLSGRLTSAEEAVWMRGTNLWTWGWEWALYNKVGPGADACPAEGLVNCGEYL